MADTSNTRVSIVPEATEGTTPATPAFVNARITGESLSRAAEYRTSNELNPNRQVIGHREVSYGAEGGIDLEMHSGGALDTLLESLFFSSFSTNVLNLGTTRKPLTIEKTVEQGATDYFERYRGMIPDTFRIRLALGELVTGGFTFRGIDVVEATAAIAGATYAAANTTEIMDGAAGFSDVSMTGVTSPELLSLELTISNNLRRRGLLGSKASKRVGTGRFTVTGTAEFYFDNNELTTISRADDTTDLEFTIGHVTGEKYTFTLPKIKLEDVNPQSGGNDADVIVRPRIQALYDGSAGRTIQITRAVA